MFTRHSVATLAHFGVPERETDEVKNFFTVTILEFPSYEQAWAWYHSAEYAPLRELRTRLGRFDVVLVDGLGAGDAVITDQLDPWEIERIAELEAAERRSPANALAATGRPV